MTGFFFPLVGRKVDPGGVSTGRSLPISVFSLYPPKRGCYFQIYYPVASSRTPLGPKSPFLFSSGREGNVGSSEETVSERGRTRQDFWSSPQTQEFLLLFGHCPANQPRNGTKGPWFSGRLEAFKTGRRKGRWAGQLLKQVFLQFKDL